MMNRKPLRSPPFRHRDTTQIVVAIVHIACGIDTAGGIRATRGLRVDPGDPRGRDPDATEA